MAKKKHKLVIDKKSILCFVVVFAIAMAVFVPTRAAAQRFANKTIFNGEGIQGEDPESDVYMSLMSDMTPITVDKGSVFYDVFQSKDRVNVLCLGINDGMTDTIIVASYDMENQFVNLISIPRDTQYIRGNFDDPANNKINAVFGAYGGGAKGAVKLAEAVSSLLYGMPLHYYIMVDYSVVKEVMKTVGGVQVNIPFHMKYDDPTKGYELHIDIPAGEQTIDETNVMEFLRFRHTNPRYAAQGYKSYDDADLQRTKVQQEFIRTVMNKVLQDGSIIDVAKTALNSRNIMSDLTYGMAIKIASRATKGLSADNITSYSVPGTTPPIEDWGTSFFVIDKNGVADILKEIYNLTAPEPEAETSTGAAVQ